MSLEPQNPRAAVDDLFAELDPLAHPERMRTLARWARSRIAGEAGAGGGAGAGAADASAAGSDVPEGTALLAELAARGAYGGRLAVVAAAVAGAVGFLEGRLADPDAFVRGHALKASLRLPIGDAALERAMDDAPAAVRRQLVTAVVAGGRTALAERLLPQVRQLWGDEEAARLLPGCGPDAVRLLLPALFLAVVRWQALGRRHPDLVLDEVARQLAELSPSSGESWWQRNADVLAATAQARPLRVLDLLEAHCPAQLPGPVRDSLGELLKADPGRTVALVTARQRPLGDLRRLASRTALGRVARHAPLELGGLARAWSHSPDQLAYLLGVLPPSGREGLYDAATEGQDLSRGVLSDRLLDTLPRARAQSEARRMAAQAEDRGEPWSAVLGAVARLPVAEARARLLAATRRPAAEDRALAYPLLVGNVARSGEAAAVAGLLNDLQRLRNEQEPVRSPALAALAEVPPWLFTGPDAEPLERIATDALEARDSSWRTRQALSALALAVLREHAVGGQQQLSAWALATLNRVSGHTGSASLGRLDTTLRRGQEVEVFEALRPRLEAASDRADHSLTFALTRALGRRARKLPQLQELLWQAVQFGSDATVGTAVELWLDDPAARDERAARVLDLEPSAAVLPPVLRVLTHRRTDLLDVVLGEQPPYGRFLRPRAGWLPPLDAVGRWLPRQQAAAAGLVARAVADESLPAHARAAHLRTVAAVPDLGAGIVRGYLDSPDTVLAEAALGALGWSDLPAADALPLLLAHAGDDRARVALYAAARVARFVAPSRLATALRAALLPAQEAAAAPAAKVTSRKALVRLAATRLPVPAAAAVLAEAFDLPGQHPDVQAACVPVAAELLRSPAAWGLLERAADGPPVTQAAILRILPYAIQDADRARYARLVARVSRSSDPETADAATGLLWRWVQWSPGAAQTLLAAAVDLDNRRSWRAAANGLVALTAADGGAEPLLAALARLVALEAETAAGGTDAASDRDRPARRRVDHVVARLLPVLAVRQGAATRAAALRASELLCAAPDFVAQGCQLLAAAVDLDDEPARLLPALERLPALHADRPAAAVRTAETLRHRLSTLRRPGDPLVLVSAVDRFTASPGYAAGLLAVALTQALGARTGWPDQWRTRLRTLRRHPHPDVRDAALAVATAEE